MNGASPQGQPARTGFSTRTITIVAIIMLIVVRVVILVVAEPTPMQYQVLRVWLSLAVAASVSSLPGFLKLKSTLAHHAVTASGSLAVFAFVYLVNPAPMQTNAADIRVAFDEVADSAAARLIQNFTTPAANDSIVVEVRDTTAAGGVAANVQLLSTVARHLGRRVDSTVGMQRFMVPQQAFTESITNDVRDRFAISDEMASALASRAWRNRRTTKGASVLWIDDVPEANQPLVELLTSIGLRVETVRSSADARVAIGRATPDMLISDIDRGGQPDEGIRFLGTLQRERIVTPMVFYVGFLRRDLEIPPGAFGITNKPAELVQLVLDVLERQRS